MATGKRYYWLKLKRDFFKRHDIRIVEGMPNGKDYVLFYLKLLVESIDHNGLLRFSDTIPYDETMLATITNTNIDIVRAALAIFQKLELMEFMDDQTIFMREVQSMIGSETDYAEKKRLWREEKQAALLTSGDNVPELSCGEETMSDKSKSKSKSIENIVSSYEETCPEPEVSDGGKTKKKRREPEPLAKDHWAYKSAVWLSKRIRKRLPHIKEPTEKDIQRWARDIEKIERIDGYDKEIVSDMLIFSQKDQFWQKNILSGDALRRNFDKLMAKEASTHDD